VFTELFITVVFDSRCSSESGLELEGVLLSSSPKTEGSPVPDNYTTLDLGLASSMFSENFRRFVRAPHYT
jgi:hypothetical protein